MKKFIKLFLVALMFLLALPSTNADASILDPNDDSDFKTFITELKEQIKSDKEEIKQSALENIKAIDGMTLSEKIDFIKALKDPETLKENMTVDSSKNVMEPDNPPLILSLIFFIFQYQNFITPKLFVLNWDIISFILSISTLFNPFSKIIFKSEESFNSLNFIFIEFLKH